MDLSLSPFCGHPRYARTGGLEALQRLSSSHFAGHRNPRRLKQSLNCRCRRNAQLVLGGKVRDD